MLFAPVLLDAAKTSAQGTEAAAPSTTFFSIVTANTAPPAAPATEPSSDVLVISAPAAATVAPAATTVARSTTTAPRPAPRPLATVAAPAKVHVEAETVTAVAPGEPLPNTGAFSLRLLLQALALLALGGIVLTRERARRVPRHLDGVYVPRHSR